MTREQAILKALMENRAECELTHAMQAMITFAEAARAIGNRMDDAPTLLALIEAQQRVIAGYANLSGRDPSIADEIGAAVLDLDIPIERVNELTASLLRGQTIKSVN